MTHSDFRAAMRRSSLKHLQEVNDELLSEGVPVEVVACMSAHALGRIMGPSYSEIARSLVPIEPMPCPSALCYWNPELD